MNTLSPERIREGLESHFVGQHILYYHSIGSTNQVAKDEITEGAPEGTLVITEEQTAGKGRLDRRWITPPETSLLMSLIFYPDLRSSQAPRVMMVCALGVAEGIEEVTDLAITFKWPNDILVQGKKTGGILIEISMTDEQLAYSVVGIGLNVNFDPGEMPDIPPDATSLSVALGQKVPRVPLLQAILKHIEKRYLNLQEGHNPHKAWARRLNTLGKVVRVSTLEREEAGLAQGIGRDGALLLRCNDGQLLRIAAGDVTLRAPTGE